MKSLCVLVKNNKRLRVMSSSSTGRRYGQHEIEKCYCSVNCLLLTSMTNWNPRRRFYACPKYKVSLIEGLKIRLCWIYKYLHTFYEWEICELFGYLQANREGIRNNECDYFAWYDGEMCERAKQLINEIEVERKGLLKET